MSTSTAIRTCRKCGCDDNHACAGGCRWTDGSRLCSRCRPPVFAHCLLCPTAAPETAEDAIRDGWTEHGICPDHSGTYPLPFVRPDRARQTDGTYHGPYSPV
ncbi:MAG TPA: hypothetical protein VH092_20305 [Urbifossiella sp.]|jgi:hypothetical protein|nr:hypothetical protein [Urbifossiella sp.]